MTILHFVGDAVRSALTAVPLPLVRWLFVGSLVLMLVWVIRLPADATHQPGGSRRWSDNLKFGAALALLIQILLYAFL